MISPSIPITLPPIGAIPPVPRAEQQPYGIPSTDIDRAWTLADELSYDQILERAARHHGAERAAAAASTGWLSLALMALLPPPASAPSLAA